MLKSISHTEHSNFNELIWKCLNKTSPSITWDYYNSKSNHYNFRGKHSLPLNKCRTRSSHRRCSMKKGVLRNFVNLTEKHLCQSLFFNKVAGLSHWLLTPLNHCFCSTKTELSKADFKGAIIWNNLPNHFKEVKSLPEFKTLIREWAQLSCTWCICS